MYNVFVTFGENNVNIYKKKNLLNDGENFET
jgi:hypothetical protein